MRVCGATDIGDPLTGSVRLMCRAVKCHTCGKTTWAGCGQHVAQVKQGVPAQEWCAGHPKEQTPGLFARFFRR